MHLDHGDAGVGNGRRSSGPWYDDERTRALLERGLRRTYPEVRRRFVKAGANAGLLYSGTVEFPGYPSRHVLLCFPKGLTAESVRIFVDGPDESPHRFNTGALCVWFADDPPEKRWVLRDGLVTLLDLVVLHLFKEAYWRETDEWLGDEAPHGIDTPTPPPRRIRRAR